MKCTKLKKSGFGSAVTVSKYLLVKGFSTVLFKIFLDFYK